MERCGGGAGSPTIDHENPLVAGILKRVAVGSLEQDRLALAAYLGSRDAQLAVRSLGGWICNVSCGDTPRDIAEWLQEGVGPDSAVCGRLALAAAQRAFLAVGAAGSGSGQAELLLDSLESWLLQWVKPDELLSAMQDLPVLDPLSLDAAVFFAARTALPLIPHPYLHYDAIPNMPEPIHCTAHCLHAAISVVAKAAHLPNSGGGLTSASWRAAEWQVSRALTRDLVPWLLGEWDPVAARVMSRVRDRTGVRVLAAV